MSAPLKPWESSNGLENKGQIHRNSQLPTASTLRAAPALPPRPSAMNMGGYSGYNSGYSPYSSMGNSYSYGSYGSMGWPGRSMYGGGYGGYGGGYGYGTGYGSSYGMYGNYMPGMGGIRDDAESRFIQFAEESSRNTFANVESIVRAFNGIAMMLDNTFFAMTSSFRAVLGVAENFGRLRSMFGHIWQAVNIFRLVTWLHRKLMGLLGVKVASSTNSLAWNEAVNGIASEASGSSGGSSWPTLAFFGILFSAPYFISKLLPKYEDKCDPAKWKANGIPAKAVFDFAATSPNELTLHTNDEILLAPKSVQEEMHLSNSGWAYATCNDRSGVVPLNYIVIVKRPPTNGSAQRPVLSPIIHNPPRKVQKRVSFGETQIFEPPAVPSVDIPPEVTTTPTPTPTPIIKSTITNSQSTNDPIESPSSDNNTDNEIIEKSDIQTSSTETPVELEKTAEVLAPA